MKATPRHDSDGIALIMVMCAIFVLSALAAGFALSRKLRPSLRKMRIPSSSCFGLAVLVWNCALYFVAASARRKLRFAEPKMGRWIRQPGRIQQRVVVHLAR